MAPLKRFLTLLCLTAALVAAVPNSGQRGNRQIFPLSRVPIANPEAEHIIPDAYIVVYNDTIDDATVNAHQTYWAATLAKRNKDKRSTTPPEGSSSHTNRPLSTTLRAFTIGSMRAMALDADESTAIEIQSADEVAFLEADAHVYLTDVVEQGNSTTGLARLSAKQTGETDYFYDDSAGEGVTAYVVDTGASLGLYSNSRLGIGFYGVKSY